MSEPETHSVLLKIAAAGWPVVSAACGFVYHRHRKLAHRIDTMVTRKELAERFDSLSERLDAHAEAAHAAERRAEESRQQSREVTNRMALHLAVIAQKLDVSPPTDYNHHG